MVCFLLYEIMQHKTYLNKTKTADGLHENVKSHSDIGWQSCNGGMAFLWLPLYTFMLINTTLISIMQRFEEKKLTILKTKMKH